MQNLFSRVKTKELIVFSRQLAVMVSATVPIVEALKIITRQIANPAFKEVARNLASDVEGGARLSLALSKFPHLFNSFFINVIKSGETTGRLDEVLNYLADQQEKEHDLMSRIKGALIYPAFIFCGLIAVGVIMLVFVFPQLLSVLKEANATLPFTTRMLMGTSYALTHYWLVLVLALGTLAGGIRYGKNTPQGKVWWDMIKIYTPALGSVSRNIYLVRFTQNLNTLLKGGIPLADALLATSDVLNNTVYKKIVIQTAEEVRDGHPMAPTLEASGLFPLAATQILDIGEQTGKLEEVLWKLTNFYTLELETSVRVLMSLLEPLILVIMGIGVGIMVSAVILPMYQMASQL